MPSKPRNQGDLPAARTRLDSLDHDRVVTAEEYKAKLKEYQIRLLGLQRQLKESRHSMIIIVEGPDAAGKGGAIKRLVEKLDPRSVRVWSVVKPTEDEYRRHYLHRFWARLPAYGEIAIFDRSWYGRTLVERVEGFATEAEWKRAYREINEFERLLADDGAIFAKAYLHISKEEQLARFKRRAADPLKHWKISDEDWRNRRKWEQHVQAAEEMFRKTSTPYAQWQVVPSNFKWYARLRTIKIAIRALEKCEARFRAG